MLTVSRAISNSSNFVKLFYAVQATIAFHAIVLAYSKSEDETQYPKITREWFDIIIGDEC